MESLVLTVEVPAFGKLVSKILVNASNDKVR